MSMTLYLLAGLFLPLFPLSMPFNLLLARLQRSWQRAGLMLLWPQIGVLLVNQAGGVIPDWLLIWALLSAALYAFRALDLREVGLWTGFLATSAWALLWVGGATDAMLHLQALGFSLPLVLLSLLTGAIQRRFGAAHSACNCGLAASAPRLAALFVVSLLAVVATPVFPGFFTLLAVVLGQAAGAPWVAVCLVLIWLLWTWSGARLMQGIVVGPPARIQVADVSAAQAWGHSLGLLALAVAGIELGGVLL